ncbi:MAG: TraR/DksA C4-type zinc finger protein [Rubrivivax sp.]|nr:TraR/DksA C4-type zinc finger protein [Pyrinomonadaceae bacterium]
MLPSLPELLEECRVLHGHLCPGQVLGARMALLGCGLINVRDPRVEDRKKLIVWVEIDRCMADAIGAATGVRLGRRSLKFVDFGKVAATFHNAATGKSFRIVALESSRALADQLFPSIVDKKDRQMKTYLSAADEDLFAFREVVVNYVDNDKPGHPRIRVICELCGEGVNDGREVQKAGQQLCRPCASQAYYHLT